MLILLLIATFAGFFFLIQTMEEKTLKLNYLIYAEVFSYTPVYTFSSSFREIPVYPSQTTIVISILSILFNKREKP
jgi:hypothetical protein